MKSKSRWAIPLIIFGLLLKCGIAFGAVADIEIVPGCTELGSNIQNNNHNLATNGAGFVVYSWIDADGVLHASMTKPGETNCTALPLPNVQGVIPARSKVPQITIDNAGNIMLAFLTATSNNFQQPPSAPQHINGIKVSTLNVNAAAPQWIDISKGLDFTESPTSKGNLGIELSMVGNGRGDTMLIWYEELSHLNDQIKATIFNVGVTGSPQWLTYTLDEGTAIISHNINSGNSKPNASINASGEGMFFWMGSKGVTPPDQSIVRAAAINASKDQKLAPLAPTSQAVGHHVDFPFQENGPIAYAGAIDANGDALAIWPDVNSGFQKMQYNTFSAKTGKWDDTDPDRTIPGTTVTVQTNSILMQIAPNPNKSHPYSFAVWNQTVDVTNTNLLASIYNKANDTWNDPIIAAVSSGEFGIGVDCFEEGILVYRNNDPIKATLFPNISEGSLDGSLDLGFINTGDVISVLPVTSIVQGCLAGDKRIGAVVWGVVFAAESHSLQSGFFELTSPPASSLLPPINLKGKQVKNKFATQTDLINVITWSANPLGALASGYKVFRNKALTDLAATIPASGLLQFDDHNRRSGISYTYYIVAVDAEGNQSLPALVNVGSKK